VLEDEAHVHPTAFESRIVHPPPGLSRLVYYAACVLGVVAALALLGVTSRRCARGGKGSDDSSQSLVPEADDASALLALEEGAWGAEQHLPSPPSYGVINVPVGLPVGLGALPVSQARPRVFATSRGARVVV